MDVEFGGLTPEEVNHLNLEYKDIDGFILRHPTMSYIDFDYYLVNDLTLFKINPDFDLDEIEERVAMIIKYMPALKKIFSKPVLQLISNYEIVPVESVRLINNDTIHHIANHQELWNNVKEDTIEPRKLLTNIYKDDYSLYENIVFCNTIDDILLFSRKSISIMKDMIYTDESIQLNLLERGNHINYFLALGKLHTGYVRSFTKAFFSTKPCLAKLQYINSTITPRLKKPIYRNNKIRPRNLKLHKTNILSKHKDYQKVYRLAKSFEKEVSKDQSECSIEKYNQTAFSYFHFCEILAVFAAGHFDFHSTEKSILNFNKLQHKFYFKEWKLRITGLIYDDIDFIALDIEKDKEYKIALVPTLKKDLSIDVNRIKGIFKADEYIVIHPFEDLENSLLNMRISIADIESFRRIQQVLLRGMIYADTKKDECPFCKDGHLEEIDTLKANQRIYQCETCKTLIYKEKCPETGREYFYTSIADYKPEYLKKSRFTNSDTWLYERLSEGKLFFRNITLLNEDLSAVCPCCGKSHDKKTVLTN